MTYRHEFAQALCKAVGLDHEYVSELTLRLRVGRPLEVEAALLVIDGGKVERVFREYQLEPFPREESCPK